MSDSIIHNHVLWSCAAGAVPVPLIDFVAVTAIQLDMLRQLASHYKVEYSEDQGKAWVAALCGGIAARIGGNLLKLIPGIGTLLGGISVSIMSGASTYALGQVASAHFAQRGSFEDLDFSAAKRDFDAAFEEGKRYAESAKDEPVPPRSADKPSAAPQAGADSTEQSDALDGLERLGALRQAGHLSDDEFQSAKSRYLRRL